MKLVIVESPSKAKTIGKYLGKDYKVVASYGHIMQLPSKQGSVKPENNFDMQWEETKQAQKHLKEIAAPAKVAEEIYLATDPDREGEAISWHIVNYLHQKKLIKKGIPIKRVVFNAITKENIQQAFLNPRDIDNKLVEAYLARLSLDYLVGFNISPILWHKLPGTKSAGRVQSVSLRLIAEREAEIEEFIPEEYWSITGLFNDDNKTSLTAKLFTFNGAKLGKLEIKTKEEADNIIAVIKADTTYYIKEITQKKLTRNPYAPFTTSTLQQEAFNRLGFSAKKTMSLAQKLYEGINLGKETIGLITYMRTDATQITPAFIAEIRKFITDNLGSDYLYKSVRAYKTKAKNAQEAHEAIRPSNIKFPPAAVKERLSGDEFKLYELIWNRAIASQMESARYNNTNLEIANKEGNITFKASGSVLEFEGFYKIYGRSSKENEDILPNLKVNAKLKCSEVKGEQHFTESLPRYTEASLVKNLEELGIGRPSTYASIIGVLVFREYARIENKKFYLEERGRILNIFLTRFFSKYVDYNFTANMEEQLDEISDGNITHINVLNTFWNNFHTEVEAAKDLSPNLVIEALNEALAEKFIGRREEDTICPTCNKGHLLIKTSKYGAFIGCSLYPTCKYIRKLEPLHEGSTDNENNNKELTNGQNLSFIHPESKEVIAVKKGPYGLYVESIIKNKPKRVALPSNLPLTDLTLEKCLLLLEIPKKLTDKITLGIGRFGPYLKQGTDFISLKEDMFTLTPEKAEELVLAALKKKRGIELGSHPNTKKPIILKFSRFGAYLVYNNDNIKIPKEYKNLKENLPLETALKIIDADKKPKK